MNLLERSKSAAWFSACAAIASLSLLGSRPATAALPANGTPAPDFQLTGTDGSTFRLSDQLGRHNVVLSLLLETPCPDCQKQAAALNAAQGGWAPEMDARLVFVKPDTLQAVKEFATGVTGLGQAPIYVDSNKVVPKAFSVGMFQFHGAQRYLPATFIIDRAGIIRASYASTSNSDRPTMTWIAAELAKLPPRAVLEEGKPMPPFALPDQNGVVHHLSDSIGKQPVVLTFYPKDMTRGCTKEACSIRDNQTALQATGAVVYGVSVDSIDSHKQFIAKESLNYTLLSDGDKGFTRYLGLLNPAGYANRVTIVVDKQEIVRTIDRGVKVDTHGLDLLEHLKGLDAAH